MRSSCRSMTIVLLAALLAAHVQAIARRVNEPWSVILCKYAELPQYEPRSREWVANWIYGEQSSIETYFAQVSNSLYTIHGSNVIGWLQLPYTQKEVLRLANADTDFELGSQKSFQSLLLTNDDAFDSSELSDDASLFQYFDKIKELCVQAAIDQNASVLDVIISATSTKSDHRKCGLDSGLWHPNTADEMVHSFFIGHSYSDRKIRVFPYALQGEYDDRFDLMSTANAYMHRTRFGMTGPGLNGAHLDFLGWLPMDRVLYFGKDGRQNYTLRLSSLSLPHARTKGWLLVMIPYDRDDPRNFYTVELRTPHNFDRGIVQPSVLVHRVARSGSSYYSVLLSHKNDFYELTEHTETVQFLQPTADGRFQVVRISVRRLYSSDADITLSSTFAPADCQLGESRVPIDESSTTTPADIEASNSTNSSVASACVDSTRRPTAVDIRKQRARDTFYSSLETFGANTCKSGFVWRSIDAYDYVCVEQGRRELAQAEAEKQIDRVGESGSGCVEPYLERLAFAGAHSDTICVSPIERLLTIRENAQASRHIKYFEFFNGEVETF